MFDLHRIIKAERNVGRWSKYMVEINNQWKNNFQQFVSAHGTVYIFNKVNGRNKKPFRLTKNKKKISDFLSIKSITTVEKFRKKNKVK